MGKDNLEKVKRLVKELDPVAPLGTDFEYINMAGLERELRATEEYLEKVRDYQPRRWTHPDDIPFRNGLIREYEEKIEMIKKAQERIKDMAFDTAAERDALAERLEGIARRLRDAPIKGEKEEKS